MSITENAKLLNPVTLAFMGDAVYEIMAREKIIEENLSLSPKNLHLLTVEKVKAAAQAEGYERIEEMLTEEEENIYKRGRNAANVHAPKGSTIKDYRSATGVEALFGYLYLTGRKERAQELFNNMWREI